MMSYFQAERGYLSAPTTGIQEFEMGLMGNFSDSFRPGFELGVVEIHLAVTRAAAQQY